MCIYIYIYIFYDYIYASMYIHYICMYIYTKAGRFNDFESRHYYATSLPFGIHSSEKLIPCFVNWKVSDEQKIGLKKKLFFPEVFRGVGELRVFQKGWS